MRPAPALGPGQPLRGDRIHRYVTAFCPRCHADDPPLDRVRRLAGVLLGAQGFPQIMALAKRKAREPRGMTPGEFARRFPPGARA